MINFLCGLIGFFVGGAFGVMLMALVVGCRKEEDDAEIH